MDKEDQLFLRHLKDLADVCYQRDIPVYTDFLNLHEQTVFLEALPEFSHVRAYLDGGYQMAERKIVCFLPVYSETDSLLPIIPIRISSSAGKFTVPCSHRDYLGAVLSLGIERGKIGDFLVGDGFAFVLCEQRMAEFLMKELTSVRKNPVICRIVPFSDLEGSIKFETITGSVASLRMDSLLALMTKTSRSKASDYLGAEKVSLNGKLCISNSAVPKEGDVISVRGVGKYIFDGARSTTKKGRQMVQIRKYS